MTDKEINYLGALLHDIGKFKWRSQSLKAGDDHEKLGEEFIREYLGKMDCLKNDIEKVIKAANRQIGKVWIADVTGAKERQGIEDKTPRRPLASILQRVSKVKTDNCKPSEIFHFYNPEKLERDVVIPSNDKKELEDCIFDDNLMIDKHKIIWDQFLIEVLKLKESKNFKVFLDSFYSLLEKYTSKVLSAGYLSYPDISLFDHSRVVAALSICYEDGKENNECLLIQGDISGIQNYIYNEVYKTDRVAKKLRGRSFYISLLTDVISSFILNDLKLYKPNLLYNGGGHFLLLAPNNNTNKENLNKIEKYINEKLFEKYSGKLQFVLGYVEDKAETIITSLDDVYKRLTDEMSNKKKQMSYSILEQLFSNAIDFKKIDKSNEYLDKEEEMIGKILPRSNYIVEIEFEKDINFDVSSIEVIDFANFKRSIILSNDKTNKNNIEIILSNIKPNEVEQVNICRINDTDFIDQKFFTRCDFPVSNVFKFVGNYSPIRDKKNYEIMSFEELAKLKSENYPMLGIARMDLDSLGAVFAFGLKEETIEERKYTISRIAYLSRELVQFFCGNINKIAEDNDVYIAYSGGDDVFAVGSWLNIIGFIQQVKNEFFAFVCQNPNLTISCGVTFTKPNFPIANSAKIAGAEEKKAKEEDEIFKSRVSCFSTVVKWEEFENLVEFGKGLNGIISEKEGDSSAKIPRSFIHSLLEMTRECFDVKGKIKMNKVYKVSARLHYLFGRRKITDKKIEEYENIKDEKTKDFKIELAKSFLKSENPGIFYKHFNIPASYVIYKTRK